MGTLEGPRSDPHFLCIKPMIDRLSSHSPLDSCVQEQEDNPKCGSQNWRAMRRDESDVRAKQELIKLMTVLSQVLAHDESMRRTSD